MSFQGKRLIDIHTKSDSSHTQDEDNEKLFHNNHNSGMDEDETMNEESAKVHFYLYLFIILLAMFSFWLNGQYYIEQVFIPSEPLVNHAIYALNSLHLQTPKKYLDSDKLNKHSQLPFCVLIPSNFQSSLQEAIQQSLNDQKYKNFVVVEIGKIWEQIGTQEVHNEYTFQQLHTQIKQKCQQKAILFFANQPLKNKALFKLNYHYQTYNAWLTYDLISEKNLEENLTTKEEVPAQRIVIEKLENIKKIEIISVYKNVFDMIQTNDFTNINAKFITSGFNKYFVMSALLELTKYFSLPLPTSLFFRQNNAKTHSFVSYTFESKYAAQNSQKYKRIRYQPLHSLAQDYKIQDIKTLNQNRQLFLKSKIPLTEKYGLFDRENQTSHSDIEKALELKQVLYLPENHSLNKLQRMRLNLLYQIQKYQNNQLPLCVSINSRNNVKNNRYKKVLESVAAQKYSNFQIVFIDDFSTDGTLEKTKEYLEETLKFPKEKVTYVKNLVQKGVTFNILNAAYNYCKKDSIQIPIDGNDQIIGKLKLQLVNSQYQAHDLWVFFTFYMNDKYKEGISLPFKHENYANKFGGRKMEHVMGPLFSFKVGLIQKIPLKEHTNEMGNFLQTLSNTALQYPLFQMSGQKRVSSINEVAYLQFNSQGQNNQQSLLKSIGRLIVHTFISWRSPQAQLTNLQGSQNKEVRNALKKLKDVDFTKFK